jgi:hypothetical protein
MGLERLSSVLYRLYRIQEAGQLLTPGVLRALRGKEARKLSRTRVVAIPSAMKN